MQRIPTRVHGVLHYAIGAFLIVSPSVLDFRFGGPETWVPVLIGAASICYSLFTDFELGAFRFLSMSTHLKLDFLASALLLASPWLFDFDHVVHWPHLLLGLAGILVVVMSQRFPDSEMPEGGDSEHSHGQPGRI